MAEAGFRRLGGSIREAISGQDRDFSARVRRATGAFAHFATENPALLDLMNATKHRPEKTGVTRAAESAFSPLVDLIHEGQEREVLRAGHLEEIGTILYATINGLATLVNNGLIAPGRLDDFVETAVTQFLKGAAP